MDCYTVRATFKALGDEGPINYSDVTAKDCPCPTASDGCMSIDELHDVYLVCPFNCGLMVDKVYCRYNIDKDNDII